jgi:hypothetical protein
MAGGNSDVLRDLDERNVSSKPLDCVSNIHYLRSTIMKYLRRDVSDKRDHVMGG